MRFWPIQKLIRIFKEDTKETEKKPLKRPFCWWISGENCTVRGLLTKKVNFLK